VLYEFSLNKNYANCDNRRCGHFILSACIVAGLFFVCFSR
jgi:hypothetical protein